MCEVLISRQPLCNEKNVWKHKGNHPAIHKLGTQGWQDKVKKKALQQGEEEKYVMTRMDKAAVQQVGAKGSLNK